MPSSTDGVYLRGGNLIDYYGNPIDLSQYNLLGPTGPAGSTGQDLFYVPGGTGTVERILSDIFTATDSSVLTPTSTEINIGPFLQRSGQIIKFSISQNTEDGTGDILGVFLQYQSKNAAGATVTTQLFNANLSAPNNGLYPAEIKYDKDPGFLSPSGYPSAEKINFVESEFQVSFTDTGAPSGFNSIFINATIYGYNSELQYQFGYARFPQKIWRISGSWIFRPPIAGPSWDPTAVFVAGVNPDGFGASVRIFDVLRYNTF
jgi:hypothetical protein